MSKEIKGKRRSWKALQKHYRKYNVFSKDQLFFVRKRVKISQSKFCNWISKRNEEKMINKRFLRQELFVLVLFKKTYILHLLKYIAIYRAIPLVEKEEKNGIIIVDPKNKISFLIDEKNNKEEIQLQTN